MQVTSHKSHYVNYTTRTAIRELMGVNENERGADGPPPFRPSVGSLYGWTAPLIFLGEVNKNA